MNSIVAYSAVGRRLGTALAFLVVLICWVPAVLAAADLQGTAETQVPIRGSGFGELRHEATRMDWYPRVLADARAVQIIEGATIVVTVREVKTYVVNPGGPQVGQDDAPQPHVVGEFHDARLELTSVGPLTRWMLVENGPTTSQTDTANHFSVTPPRPVDSEAAVGNETAQSWERFFDRRADDLELEQLQASTRGTGDFSFYVLNSSFAIEGGGQRQLFEAFARDEVSAGPAARASTMRAYIVDVYGGAYDTTAVGGRTTLRSNQFEGAFTGSLVLESAQGTLQTPHGRTALAGDRLDLSGEITVDLRSRRTDGAVLLHADFEQRDAGISGLSRQIAATDAKGTTWALPLAVGGVLAMAGAAALRYPSLRTTVGARLRAPAPGPDPVGQPAPTPADTTRLAEDAYRADPGNIQRGMELALHYATANRYEDALPLLLMTVRHFPKSDVARYTTALALLHVDRVEEALDHLEYAFRLNPLNVARFVKEGPAHVHGRKPLVERLLNRWARAYHDSNSRGYA